MEGFMKNLILYNINNLQSFDKHAKKVVDRVKSKINEKSQTYSIKNNFGKDVKWKLESKDQEEKVTAIRLMRKKDFNHIFLKEKIKKLPSSVKEKNVSQDSALKLRKKLM